MKQFTVIVKPFRAEAVLQTVAEFGVLGAGATRDGWLVLISCKMSEMDSGEKQ